MQNGSSKQILHQFKKLTLEAESKLPQNSTSTSLVQIYLGKGTTRDALIILANKAHYLRLSYKDCLEIASQYKEIPLMILHDSACKAFLSEEEIALLTLHDEEVRKAYCRQFDIHENKVKELSQALSPADKQSQSSPKQQVFQRMGEHLVALASINEDKAHHILNTPYMFHTLTIEDLCEIGERYESIAQKLLSEERFTKRMRSFQIYQLSHNFEDVAELVMQNKRLWSKMTLMDKLNLSLQNEKVGHALLDEKSSVKHLATDGLWLLGNSNLSLAQRIITTPKLNKKLDKAQRDDLTHMLAFCEHLSIVCQHSLKRHAKKVKP